MPAFFVSWCLCGSNHRAAGYYAVFGYDDDPIANVISRSVEVLDSLIVKDPDVLSDVGVLIDDGLSDNGPLTDPDVGNPQLAVVFKILFVFVEIRAHHHGALEF